MKNYKHIIFDLDGVLINSKKNMRVSWQATSSRFNLNVAFKNYFSKIGIPFEKILQALDLDIPKNKIKSITEHYSKISIKNFWNINLYPDVKETLNTLRKKNIIHSVVTSKDLKRSKLVMKKFGLKFFSFYSASLRKPGKPNPRLILDCIKNSKIEKKILVMLEIQRLILFLLKEQKLTLSMQVMVMEKQKKKLKTFVV